MSKRTYELIVTISGAVSAIAIGLVTYFKPQYATAINSSIEIAESAIVAICGNFAINNGLEKKQLKARHTFKNNRLDNVAGNFGFIGKSLAVKKLRKKRK